MPPMTMTTTKPAISHATGPENNTLTETEDTTWREEEWAR
jgi:hypothetical protein